MTPQSNSLGGFTPFLKIGGNKEKKVFDFAAGREAYDGVIVSAMMLEGFYERTSSFLKGLGKKYIIDPSTYVFQQRAEALTNDNGTKKNYHSMAAFFGPPVQGLAGVRTATPTDFLSKPGTLEAFTHRVIDYQRQRVKGGATLFDDLEEFMQSSSGQMLNSAPAILLPPYFHFRSPADPWYEVNLACAKAALKYAKPGEKVWPVVLTSPALLTEMALINKVCADFDSLGSPGYLVWIDGFKDEQQSLVKLRGLKQLIGLLASQGKHVLRLYGGFFSFLLSDKGLSGFASGPGYGSSKKAFAYSRKGGPSIPSFYVEKLRANFQLDEAEALLRRHPELICGCEVCRTTYGKNLDRFKELKDAGRFQSHFLNVRLREIAALRSAGLPAVLDDLRETIAILGSVNTQHLSTWLTALDRAAEARPS